MEREPLELLNKKDSKYTDIKPIEEIILRASHGMQVGVIAQEIVTRQGEKLSSIPVTAEFMVYHPQYHHLMAAYTTPDGFMYWQHFQYQEIEVVPLNFSAS